MKNKKYPRYFLGNYGDAYTSVSDVLYRYVEEENGVVYFRVREGHTHISFFSFQDLFREDLCFREVNENELALLL